MSNDLPDPYATDPLTFVSSTGEQRFLWMTTSPCPDCGKGMLGVIHDLGNTLTLECSRELCSGHFDAPRYAHKPAKDSSND